MAFVKSSTYFGQFGGRYVPEMLQPTLEEVAKVYDKLRRSPKFIAELQDL
jgi:tryptophan synthase beta chain